MSTAAAILKPHALPRRLHLLLRLGVAACFIGHGAFGILQKEAWLPFFELVGIGPAAAFTLMPLIGAADIAVGILALVYPVRAIFLYGAVWCLWTAALRPLTGMGIWEMVERAGNYGVPLAMLALVGTAATGRGWFRRIRVGTMAEGGLDRAFLVLQWTTALLLIGHGALALTGSPLLGSHLAAAGLSGSVLPLMGATEVALAAAILIRPHPVTFVYIALWKLATESLFLVAGSPFWEVIERGGSYAAPIAAAMVMIAPALRRDPARARPQVAAVSGPR